MRWHSPKYQAAMALGISLASWMGCGGDVSSSDDGQGGATDFGSGGGAEPAMEGGASGSGTGGATTGGAAAGGSPYELCTTEDGREGVMVDTFRDYNPGEYQCEAFNQPGTMDNACPEEPYVECGSEACLIGFAGYLQGCCRPDGWCGLWDSGFYVPDRTLGCISRVPWTKADRDVFGADRPVPVACTPEP